MKNTYTIRIACLVYIVSMVAANAVVGHLGPWISPINAFIFIGLDLALRDWLHVRLQPLALAGLIVLSGILTFALNAAPMQIAVASSVAFMCAATGDWLAFSALKHRRWLVRSNGSNVVGAAIDSAIFPTIAFGLLLPHIVALQFLAKVSGGAIWSWILRK